MTVRRSSRAGPTTGRTGVWCAAATVSTSGATPPRWSSPTAPTAGSGSSSTASWRRCTRAGVPRAAQTAQVGTPQTAQVGTQSLTLGGKLATMYSSGSPEGGSDSSGRHPITDTR